MLFFRLCQQGCRILSRSIQDFNRSRSSIQSSRKWTGMFQGTLLWPWNHETIRCLSIQSLNRRQNCHSSGASIRTEVSTSVLSRRKPKISSEFSCCSRRILCLTLHESESAMREDAKTVASWDFERIIPCHGVRLYIQHETVTSIKRVIGMLLKARTWSLGSGLQQISLIQEVKRVASISLIPWFRAHIIPVLS